MRGCVCAWEREKERRRRVKRERTKERKKENWEYVFVDDQDSCFGNVSHSVNINHTIKSSTWLYWKGTPFPFVTGSQKLTVGWLTLIRVQQFVGSIKYQIFFAKNLNKGGPGTKLRSLGRLLLVATPLRWGSPGEKSCREVPCRIFRIRGGTRNFWKSKTKMLGQRRGRGHGEKHLDSQQPFLLRGLVRASTFALPNPQLLKTKVLSAVASPALFPRPFSCRFFKDCVLPRQILKNPLGTTLAEFSPGKPNWRT